MDGGQGPAEFAGKINTRLERFMPVIPPLGTVLGFLFPRVFFVIRPLTSWFFAFMTLSGALKLRARELGLAVRNPLPVLLFYLSAHVAMPLLVFLISSRVFPNDMDTISGYVLLFSSPTAVSGFIWVSIFRGDPALSLALILLGTVTAPLVMPGTAFLLLGAKVSLDMAGIALSLVFMVVAPTIIGIFLNEASRGKVPALVCPYLSPLSKVFMILVIAANSAAAAPQVHFGEPKVWLIAVLCICFSITGFSCSKLSAVLGKLNPSREASLFFAAGLRNITAATTIAIKYFPPAAAQPAVLGILFQQVLAALMGRLLLGKAESRPPAG